MMKINITSWAICRTPVFPLTSKFNDSWSKLKNLIFSASPQFYEVIKDCDTNNIDKLSPKARFTIWKYYNRAKFRATPFGEFGSISLVPLGLAGTVDRHVTLNSDMKVHRYLSWSQSPNTRATVGDVLSNSSFYITGGEIRFIAFENSLFHLSSIEYNSLVLDILLFCQKKRDRISMYEFLNTKGIDSNDEAENVLQQLIDVQLIITQEDGNIVGQSHLDQAEAGTLERKGFYEISERKHLTGKLSLFKEHDLKCMIAFLAQHVRAPIMEDLIQFKQEFNKRYENQTKPLLTVLDPETGIGYKNLVHHPGENSIVDELLALHKTPENSELRQTYSNLDKFVLKSLQSGSRIIDLEKCVAITENSDGVLPNTFSSVLEVADDRIYIKWLGGSTATSLLGRFTIACKQIHELSKSLVQIEEQANPGVLFFDVAYSGEKHIDDINRRESIYNYLLPILNWTDDDEVIELRDVYLTVRGGEIILFSKKYQKRIIPRIASAYNYTRSDLPVFRFLADLQHQGLKSNLMYEIDAVFPDLDFYPRLSFGNIVLSPAKWRVPEFIFTNKDPRDLKNMVAKVRDWLRKIEIENFICREADQTLFFCAANLDDMEAFLMYVKSKKVLYVEEAYSTQDPLVINEFGEPYKAEFIVNFSHYENIYRGVDFRLGENSDQVKDLFLPGDQWLYYEIYCHPLRSNEIVLNFLKPLIDGYGKDIEKWFFVRFNLPTYHLRLRIRLKRRRGFLSFMEAFNTEIKKWIDSLLVSDVLIKPYKREIERYGSFGIDNVEDLFYWNSKLVVQVLQEIDESPYFLYAITLELIEEILHRAGYTIEQQFSFISNIAQAFAKEHELATVGFKTINRDYYRFIGNNKEAQYKSIGLINSHSFIAKAVSLITNCPKEKNRLLTDLFHMHINRLFSNNARTHELIIYQFLIIKLKSLRR